ncbi:MAG: MoaD/ThiS family protein [Pirellulaceae bacterium]|nr:MoaD/ThiS family protein [Pirellulaceae bacterium]
MKVTIRLFAGAAQQAGVRSLTLDLHDEANVAAARTALLEKMPQLKALSEVSLWASETEVLDDHALLKPDSELAMIPPVSGG